MKAGKTFPKKPKWIRLDEGAKKIYVYTHPDPAIHERFHIERVPVVHRKASSFLIRDKLNRVRGCRDRLFEAQKHVQEMIKAETLSLRKDIRVVVHNELARGENEKAFLAIIEHFDQELERRTDALERELDMLRRNLRNL